MNYAHGLGRPEIWQRRPLNGVSFEKRDRALGLICALLLHAVLLLAGGRVFMTSAQYGVQAGDSGVEVMLVAAPLAATPLAAETQVRPQPALPDDSPVLRETPAPVSLPRATAGDGSSATPGEDATTAYSTAGALTAAKPSYLRNPAPVYPSISRRSGEEGLVILLAEVGVDGRPGNVSLKQSSGFERLDEAARNAVSRWRFEPARLGGMRVNSSVEIPVRFRLEEASTR